MKKLFDEFYDLKIFIKNQNYILIENYKKLSLISETKIIIDNIEILGKELLIKELNCLQIQIEGVLNEISFI